jgi:glucose-6-phosphate isomerase
MTKSGSTAETMAVFLDLWDWLDPACRDSRIIAVTDPAGGDLRRLAGDRGWPSLPVPPAVGGRYSVFSAVGLLPGAFAGWDLRALLGGAAEAAEDLGLHGASSLPGRLAACWLSGFRSHPVHVLFTYSDLLADTADWFAQLWAESLGKRLDTSGREVRTGQTPLACRGPADQHSLVQLFMEGPRDKFFTFLTVSEPSGPLSGGFSGYPSVEWLEGRSLDELRLAEARATEAALAETGAPTCSLSMSGRPDERRMGALLMTMEIATVLCGIALGIDPLDQPGVERGKHLTFRRMGRPGWQ